MNITISPVCLVALLKAALLHASKDETREHLYGVRLEAHSAALRAVATDGHRIIVAEVPCVTGIQGDALIKRDDVERIVKSLDVKSATYMVTLGVGPKTWSVCQLESVRATGKTSDAMFPPYTQVVPRNAKVGSMPTINTGYLADASKAFAILAKADGRTAEGVRTLSSGPLDPIVVTAGTRATAVVVIMPMRDDDERTIVKQTDALVATLLTQRDTPVHACVQESAPDLSAAAE